MSTIKIDLTRVIRPSKYTHDYLDRRAVYATVTNRWDSSDNNRDICKYIVYRSKLYYCYYAKYDYLQGSELQYRGYRTGIGYLLAGLNEYSRMKFGNQWYMTPSTFGHCATTIVHWYRGKDNYCDICNRYVFDYTTVVFGRKIMPLGIFLGEAQPPPN